MDKLTTISATLFMAADVFAIVSLALPDWIITESGTGQCENTEAPLSYNVSQNLEYSR